MDAVIGFFADFFAREDCFAQILGIIGMAFCSISFAQKTQKVIATLQLISSTIFIFHFFMLGNIIGGAFNIVGLIRCFIYRNRDKWAWVNTKYCLAGVITVVVAVGLVSAYINILNRGFSVFSLLDLLPITGMVFSSLALDRDDAYHVRLYCIPSSIGWLCYNYISGSIGTTINEIISLVMMGYGFLFVDMKKRLAARKQK